MQLMVIPQPWRNLLLSLHVAAGVGVLGADWVLLTAVPAWPVRSR